MKTDYKMGLGYLLDLATGHYRSKTLFVATKLKVFTILAGGPKTFKEMSSILNIESRPAAMLLNACVSIGLLEKNGDTYRNSRTSSIYLVEGGPRFLGPAFFKFDDHSYLLFDKLQDAILEDKHQLPTENPDDPELLASCMQIGNKTEYGLFLSSLDPIADWPASMIARTFDFSRFKKVVDVGGGTGIYSQAIVKKHPNIQAVVFDLPYVCEIGHKAIEKKGLSDRIQYHSGNFLHDEFPEGMDLAFLSNLLHGFGPEKSTSILKRVYDSLPQNGGIIISDLILDEDGCGPEMGTMLSFYFLLITQEGRNYTYSEYKAMLEDAGFIDIEISRSSADTKYISARKP